MSALALFRLVGWRAAALAALVCGAWLWIGALRAANDALGAERDRLKARLIAHEAAAEARGRAMTALEARIAALQHAAQRFSALETEIRDAPDADDAPLAPVLARALERLREP